MSQVTEELLKKSVAYWNDQDMDGVIRTCQEILKIEPNEVQAVANMGASLWMLGDQKGAEENFRKVLKARPEWPDILLNMATIMHDQGHIEEAKDYIEKLLTIQPFNYQGRWRLGIINLALGNYLEGWSLYEDGLGVAEVRGLLPSCEKRPWTGKACNHLVICHEQGWGDTFQFLRYAKLCKERSIKVYFHGPEPLRKIIECCPYIDGFMAGLMMGDFGEYIHTLSLPSVFKTTLQTIPKDIPYIIPPANKFPMTGTFKVGIVWSGDPRKGMIRYKELNARRSMALDRFRDLVKQFPAIQFYSLQKGEGENDIVPEDNIINYMPDICDFVDTASLIADLDLVISVDTSVVHLAGAMGKPVWVLSRFDACWRWLRNREDSPWYPSARVFGQPSPGDWDSVLKKVAEELKKVTQ